MAARLAELPRVIPSTTTYEVEHRLGIGCAHRVPLHYGTPAATVGTEQQQVKIQLAFRVIEIALGRVRTDAELADLHYRAAQKGAACAKAKQSRSTKRAHHAKFLRQAQALTANNYPFPRPA